MGIFLGVIIAIVVYSCIFKNDFDEENRNSVLTIMAVLAFIIVVVCIIKGLNRH